MKISKDGLCWNHGKSLFWQGLGVVAAWSYIVSLHWNNDGLWYQGDSPRHAANGLFWWDFLSSLPVDPLEFAVKYFAHYPVITPTLFPPFFYLIEGMAYQIVGVSPFVAKGLVLGFVLLGAFYVSAWLRRWVSPIAGWAGILFLFQPAVITWGHAVMLNMPSAVLGMAALYHWRRWLEDETTNHLYLASVFAVLAVLTYLPVAIVVIVMLGWALYLNRLALLFQRRTLVVAGIAFVLLLPWLVFQFVWDSTHRSAGLYLGEHPYWTVQAWTFYAQLVPSMVTRGLLFFGLAALALGLFNTRWKKEILISIIWFGVCYMWFSIFSVRDSRYVLLLVPPIVFLGTISLIGYCQWLSEATGQNFHRLIMPILAFILGAHLWTASSVHVPRVSGFQEIVNFFSATAPKQRVFYDGIYNGVFSFYLRSADNEFKSSVMLGSKLLYATKISPQWGLIELASSPSEIVERLQHKCGCRWFVVEREFTGLSGIQAVRNLRLVLGNGDFRLIRSFQVETGNVQNVDFYEYLGIISFPSRLELPFPLLGDGKEFKVNIDEP